MRVGDKVRFLNDVGEGSVVNILDKKTVSVLNEYGFEVPILMKELIVIEEAAISPEPVPEDYNNTVQVDNDISEKINIDTSIEIDNISFDEKVFDGKKRAKLGTEKKPAVVNVQTGQPLMITIDESVDRSADPPLHLYLVTVENLTVSPDEEVGIHFVYELTQPTGDATCDGNVDFADLGALKQAWGQSSPWTPPDCCADFTQNGTVDFADLGALKQGRGQTGVVPSTLNQNCP